VDGRPRALWRGSGRSLDRHTLHIPSASWMPSRDFTSEDLFSSRMMSMQIQRPLSQMTTVGPAIILRLRAGSCHRRAYSVFFDRSCRPTHLSLPSAVRSRHSIDPFRYQAGLKVHRANTYQKRPYLSTPFESRPTRIPRDLPHPSQQPCLNPTMQNRLIGLRPDPDDNTVISAFARGEVRNLSRRWRVPRPQTARNRNFSADAGAQAP